MEVKKMFDVSVSGRTLTFFEIVKIGLVHDSELQKGYSILGLNPCGPNELKEANESDQRVAENITATHWVPRQPNSFCHAVYENGKGGPLGSPLHGGGYFPPGTIFAGK